MDHFLVDYENIGEAGLKGIENLGSDTSTVIFYSDHADKISFDMHQILSKCRSRLEFRKAQTGKKNALDFQLSTYVGYLVASHPGDRFFIISKDNGYRVVMDFWDKYNIQQIDCIGRAYEKPVRAAAAPQQPAVPAGKKPETEHQRPEACRQEAAAGQEAAPMPEKKNEQGMAPKAWENTAVKAWINTAPKASENPVAETGESQSAGPEEMKDTALANNDASAKDGNNTQRGGRRRGQGNRETAVEEKPSEELMNALSQLIDDKEERENIGRFIVKYKTKQGVNNAIVKIYGTEKAGELYKKIKPLLKDKKGK